MKTMSIARTATFIMALTLFSKLFGFIREMVLAGFYGTSEICDIYVLANTIPSSILGSIFAAIATAYMPLLAEQDRDGKANRFTCQVITLLNVFAVISVVLGLLFADPLVGLFGYTGNSAGTAAFFCRVSFCFVLFSSVTQIQTYYLQYKGVFLPQVVAGYAISISIIVFIALSHYVSELLLPFGYLVGYFVQMTVQSHFTRKEGLHYRPDFHCRETAGSIVRFAPLVFVGSMVTYINQFIDKMFATSLQEGSVSSLNYASLVQGMIIAITVTVITTIIYPVLTRAAAEGNLVHFERMLKKGISLIILITVPFSFGIIAFHGEVIQVIYERGAFGEGSTDMTSSAFLCYGVGLVFVALNTLVIQAYYALKNMKTSVWCGILGVGVNIFMDWALIKVLGNAGLALASSVAALVNTCTLMYFFRRKYPDIGLIVSWRKVFKTVAASGLAVLVAWLVYHGLAAAVWMPRLCYLMAAVAVAGVIYLAELWVMKFEELELLKGLLPGRR